MPTITRSQGVNRSEAILSALCEKAFLPLWCYPNTYLGKNKELCDLLVVFGKDIVVFSDKDRAFPNTGDEQCDWSRWKRHSVEKSIEQLVRAARWLEKHPDQVYLDAKCGTRFPYTIELGSRIHLVVVARNSKSRCRSFFGGGSGSLIMLGGESVEGQPDPPFSIRGNVDGRFIHVFDEVTLPIVLNELDTASDFLAYLTNKEVAFASGAISRSTGEEETLAFYLRSSVDGSARRQFVQPPAGSTLVIGEGHWDEVSSSRRFRNYSRARGVSVLWDDLLSTFGQLLLAEEAPNPFQLTFGQLEHLGRTLASENRFSRLLLSTALLQMHQQAPSDDSAERRILSRHFPDVEYAFVLFPRDECNGEDEYRDVRRKHLMAYALHVRDLSLAKHVVGIAAETRGQAMSTYDFCVVERRSLTTEETKLIQYARSEFDWRSDNDGFSAQYLIRKPRLRRSARG